MSDRSSLQFNILRVDPEKADAVRQYINDEWGPEFGDLFDDTVVVEEAVLGSIADQDIPGKLIELDPTIVFCIWQDPKYEYLGDVAMHTPELGTYLGPCDASANVVLTWDAMQDSPTGGDIDRRFGRPWVDAINAINAVRNEVPA